MRIAIILALFFIVTSLMGQEADSVQFSDQKVPIPLTQLREPDVWLAQDKLKHFVASAVLVGAGTYWAKYKQEMSESESFTLGCSFSFSLGLCKEIADKRSGRVFSFKDGLADLLGIVAGFLIFSWW